MKKLILIILSSFLLTSCVSNKELEITETNTPEHTYDIVDYSGEKISLEDIRGFDFGIDYVCGWTIDNPEYRKIKPKDIVAGNEVHFASSSYNVAINETKKILPYYSNYSVNLATLKGVVRLEPTLDFAFDEFAEELPEGAYVPVFYRYYEEETGYFPIISPMDDYAIEYYKSTSKIKLSDGTEVKVDPIPIYLENYEGKLFDLKLNELKETIVILGVEFFTQSHSPEESKITRANGNFSSYSGVKTL